MADDLRKLIEQGPGAAPSSSGLVGQREFYFSGIGGPQYAPIDEDSPATWSAGERQALQRQMADAGLLPRGSYANGVWDSSTQRAYKELLFMSASNRMGTQALLSQLRDAGLSGGGSQTAYLARQRFVAPPMRIPSKEALADGVRGIMSDLLGRDPSAEEMGFLSDRLREYAAEAEGQDITASRREFEAKQEEQIRGQRAEASAAGTGLEVVGAPAPKGAIGGGSVEAQSPAAALSELVRQRYSSEIGRKAQAEVTSQSSDILTAGLGTLSSALFGGNYQAV